MELEKNEIMQGLITIKMHKLTKYQTNFYDLDIFYRMTKTDVNDKP